MTFRQVTASAAMMVFLSIILQPVVARSAPTDQALSDHIRRIQTALSLYAESYDNQMPSGPEPAAESQPVHNYPDRELTAIEPLDERGARLERQRQAVMESRRAAQMWDESSAKGVIETYSDAQPEEVEPQPSALAMALAFCEVPAPTIYDMDMNQDSLNSCFKMADVFGLNPNDFCALVFAESSMQSLAKDQMQNALASAGINPSVGLKDRESTTVGCAQMSVTTALSVLEKLQESNPFLYERLGIPEQSPELPNILLRRLASDCDFAVQMQAAYAYVNTVGVKEDGSDREFEVFVKEIFNKHNEELHRRFDCLGEALRDPQATRKAREKARVEKSQGPTARPSQDRLRRP